MLVAKMYIGLPQSQPYEKNGKFYVEVTKANGIKKEVRGYTEKEWRRLYPNETPPHEEDKLIRTRFGHDGQIIIPIGKIANFKEWLYNSEARWSTVFGWYFYDEPAFLPEGLSFKIINWDDIAESAYKLKEECEIHKYIFALGGDPKCCI